jgi:predicted Zn-dependent peptidase
MVFSAAGNLEHDSFVAQVEKEFDSLSTSSEAATPKMAAPKATPHITLKRKKSLEQVQFCLGVPAPPVNDSRRYGVYLLNTMLGGGMSSRLFQTIREDQGLAYAIYSEMSPFRDTGSLCVYAGTSVDKTRKVLQLTLQELRRLKEETVSDVELKRAKDQVKSNMVIGLESSGSRMANLARQQMYFGRFFGVDEMMAEIEAVTTADVQDLAQELFQPETMALTLLGNLGSMKIERGDLAC